MAEKIKVKVVLGSVREGRFGERPARWITAELNKVDGIEAELIDLKDYPMPFFNAATSPAMMNRKYPSEIIQKWSDKMNDGDAFVLISPEYNHGYSSVLKNALDWLSPEWARKPVGFLSYGSASGARAIEQLREVAIELRMVPIQKSIHLNWEFIMKTWSNKGISDAELFDPVRKSQGPDHVALFAEDLLWMARALKAARGS
jgi:NAD(P)H-dependent FMN reductase